MSKNGLRLFIALLLSIFFESLENYFEIYCNILKTNFFETFFSRNYNYFFKTFSIIFLTYVKVWFTDQNSKPPEINKT